MLNHCNLAHLDSSVDQWRLHLMGILFVLIPKVIISLCRRIYQRIRVDRILMLLGIKIKYKNI